MAWRLVASEVASSISKYDRLVPEVRAVMNALDCSTQTSPQVRRFPT